MNNRSENNNRPFVQPSVSLSEYKLKLVSLAILLTVVLLVPTIQERLSKEASVFVADSESAHNGLPMDWDGKQALCVLFPIEHPHSEYGMGVTMIDGNGTNLGVNEDYNGTGVCVGGFEGFTNGLAFMQNSTRVAGSGLEFGYDVGEFGHLVHTIGGLNSNNVTGDFEGAYWKLDHNGATSMVGIGNLVMSEGDVLSWGIATW